MASRPAHACPSLHTKTLILAAVLAPMALLVPTPAQAQVVSWVQRAANGGPGGGPALAAANGAMVYDSARGVCVLFGGGTFGVAQTWEWNGSTWTQRFPANSPSSRSTHSMVYDSGRGVTVLYGGNGPLGDTWEYNGTNWTLRAPNGSGPPARTRAPMAYDSARGVTVLFGGLTSSYIGDTWEWNGTVWTQRSTSGPLPQLAAANGKMTFDSGRGVCVLYGGGTFGVSQTWDWNGTVWTQRILASNPQNRADHSMAYDAARGVTIVFGGTPLRSDVWEYDATNWTERLIGGPSPRFKSLFAYDSTRRVSVLMGGADQNQFLQDTWELGQSPFFTSQPGSESVCEGDPFTLTAAPSGSGPFTYQWRRGTPLANIPGANSATYNVASSTSAHTDVYVCVATSSFGAATGPATTITVAPCFPCLPDFNHDGNLDPDDLGDFITCFFTEPPCTGADYNHDTNIDPDDLGDFITAFFLGCP